MHVVYILRSNDGTLVEAEREHLEHRAQEADRDGSGRKEARTARSRSAPTPIGRSVRTFV